MPSLTRVVIGIGVIELMLAGLWYYLAAEAAKSGTATLDSSRELGQMMGGAMGAVFGFAIFLCFVRWVKTRRDSKP